MVETQSAFLTAEFNLSIHLLTVSDTLPQESFAIHV